LFAGTVNYGVFISKDNGGSWTSINSGLSNLTIRRLFFVSSNLFASTSAGLFMSDNFGSSWKSINSGLTSEVTAFALREPYLYVGTTSGKVYKRSLDEMNITMVESPTVERPTNFILYQNYPNPFNPTTTIKYSVPKQSYVTIKIFDALGREVTTLLNEEKSVGNYSIEFNASSFPSGIYFYRMQAENFMETKKLILLK
jgi:hypothetical protein